MKFISPLKVLATKVRHFILNLNQYRNTHYRVLNNCKINYKEVMKAQINHSPKFKKVLCLYKVYAPSRRSFDLGNVCSVHEKFFEDAFVELGKLPDDNIDYIPLVIYLGCGIDKERPRVEIEVLDLTKHNIDLTFKSICDILNIEEE
jgi:hypothetical protein